MSLKADVTTVVFDWNGTLLDDAALAVECVNFVRGSRGRDLISLSQYRDLFELPIQKFYSKLGLADDPQHFKASIREYLQYYSPRSFECPLHSEVRELLNHLKANRIRIAILSASSQASLDEALQHYELRDFFDFAVGKHDTEASCKKREANMLTRLLREKPEDVLYIGDTGHDAVVAAAEGWQYALVENGHQSPLKFAVTTERIPAVCCLTNILRTHGVLA